MKLILFFVRKILSLRYRVRLAWEENLVNNGPVLLLPNHVALIDPRILVSFLWDYIKVSPVASEKYYSVPVLKQIMDLLWTVPIWDMWAWADPEEVKKVFSRVVEELKKDKNILIYPSWQIYRQWYESIKWKQSVYTISQDMPWNTKILWIKIRGLWWSIWSKAWDDSKTWFWKAYLKSVFYVFANFIFFVPKREVNIEIVDITKQIDTYKKLSLNEFNSYLEHFYNEDWEEKINYIKHYFYFNDVKNKIEPDIISGSEKELLSTNHYDLSDISDDIKEKIIKKVSVIKELDISKINDNSNLVLDLFFDSLDLAEIKSYVQSNFPGSSNPPITSLKTLGDLYVMAVWKSKNEEKLKECNWWDDKNSKSKVNKLILESIKSNKSDSILTLRKKNFSKNKSDKFVWDNILWMQTKMDFILKAYFISQKIKKIKGDYVGIMMPAVSWASLLIISTYLAWKTPVMFNWTLWKQAFDHCVSFSKVDKIISVSSFFDRVKNDFLESYERDNKFVFLEDLLKTWTKVEKINALLKSIFMPIPKLWDSWVILFTSGSESLPKAVLLTHENLIENIKWALSVFELKQDDRLLWFLPPFHSFWFTINTIMPLISWMQVVYTPDPNDSRTILNIISHTKPTALSATPTFLKMIMSGAKKWDLDSLRYAVVGAEKCTEAIFSKFKELCPNWKILEWYGITECSPVISINPIDSFKPWSVWKVIPNLDCKIIDLEKSLDSKKEFRELWVWEEWMIYVSGSSIFTWYLDKNLDNPFEEIDSKKYYKTWDLWKLDKDGFLTITWRLKRFVKIAWEMISLPFIEWILLEKYSSENELKIAIEALERDSQTKIVLFSLDHLELEEVNDYLRKRGVSNLVKISEVIKIESIPVLWTGKTDYKELKKMISF